MKTLFRRLERLEDRFTPQMSAHDVELRARLERARKRLGLPEPDLSNLPAYGGWDTIVEILNSGRTRRYNPVL